MFTGLTIFRLVTAALLPVLVTVVFYLSEKKNRFHNITNIPSAIATIFKYAFRPAT